MASSRPATSVNVVSFITTAVVVTCLSFSVFERIVRERTPVSVRLLSESATGTARAGAGGGASPALYSTSAVDARVSSGVEAAFGPDRAEVFESTLQAKGAVATDSDVFTRARLPASVSLDAAAAVLNEGLQDQTLFNIVRNCKDDSPAACLEAQLGTSSASYIKCFHSSGINYQQCILHNVVMNNGTLYLLLPEHARAFEAARAPPLKYEELVWDNSSAEMRESASHSMELAIQAIALTHLFAHTANASVVAVDQAIVLQRARPLTLYGSLLFDIAHAFSMMCHLLSICSLQGWSESVVQVYLAESDLQLGQLDLWSTLGLKVAALGQQDSSTWWVFNRVAIGVGAPCADSPWEDVHDDRLGYSRQLLAAHIRCKLPKAFWEILHHAAVSNTSSASHRADSIDGVETSGTDLASEATQVVNDRPRTVQSGRLSPPAPPVWEHQDAARLLIADGASDPTASPGKSSSQGGSDVIFLDQSDDQGSDGPPIMQPASASMPMSQKSQTQRARAISARGPPRRFKRLTDADMRRRFKVANDFAAEVRTVEDARYGRRDRVSASQQGTDADWFEEVAHVRSGVPDPRSALFGSDSTHMPAVTSAKIDSGRASSTHGVAHGAARHDSLSLWLQRLRVLKPEDDAALIHRRRLRDSPERTVQPLLNPDAQDTRYGSYDAVLPDGTQDEAEADDFGVVPLLSPYYLGESAGDVTEPVEMPEDSELSEQGSGGAQPQTGTQSEHMCTATLVTSMTCSSGLVHSVELLDPDATLQSLRDAVPAWTFTEARGASDTFDPVLAARIAASDVVVGVAAPGEGHGCSAWRAYTFFAKANATLVEVKGIRMPQDDAVTDWSDRRSMDQASEAGRQLRLAEELETRLLAAAHGVSQVYVWAVQEERPVVEAVLRTEFESAAILSASAEVLPRRTDVRLRITDPMQLIQHALAATSCRARL